MAGQMDHRSSVQYTLSMLICWAFLTAQARVGEVLYMKSPKCPSPRGQFPHELFCDRYYDCWDYQIMVRQCPDDLLFNALPFKRYCDFPENVKCGTRVRNSNLHRTNAICQRQFGTFPDPEDCGAFYTCVFGYPARTLCPRFTMFDVTARVCNHAERVDCYGRGTRSTWSRSGRNNCLAANGMFAHSDDCSKYWSCREYEEKLLSCPPGQLFDRHRSVCERADKVRC